MENENTVNEQGTNQQNAENQETPKTFTQEEVNKIVQERIIRDRKDHADYDDLKAKAEKFDALEEASKTELQKATERAKKLEAELASLKKMNEINAIREKVSSATGVPASLINGEDEESCMAQAKAILEFKNPDSYPGLRDGGEVVNANKGTAQQQFSDWFNEHF